MTDEALKALHAIFLASVAVASLWLFTFPQARDQLADYEEALQVEAWLTLHRATVFVAPSASDAGEVGQLSTPAMEVLRITSTWPRHLDSLARLSEFTRSDGWVAFELQSQVTLGTDGQSSETPPSSFPLPLHEYIVLESNSGPRSGRRVVNRSYYRDISRPGVLVLNDTPLISSRVLAALAENGLAGPLSDLLGDPRPFLAWRARADPASPGTGVRVFGLDLGLGVFLFSVGVFLGLLAVYAVGPLASLRRASSLSHNQPWILAVPFSARAGGRLIEWLARISHR